MKSAVMLELLVNSARRKPMTDSASDYPIGIPGTPWAAEDISRWKSVQRKQRSYADDVLARLAGLRDRFDVIAYGELDYPPDRYPLYAVRSKSWQPTLPTTLVTGGVHGYETSGVMGALEFLDKHADAYADRMNLLVAPCVSPWAYERIHRWNPDAVDPNRSFRSDSPSAEAAALMRLVQSIAGEILVHIDLHETTDTDESEFRPALAARDGKPFEPEGIPDGFYTVGDSDNPQPEFQGAVINAVKRVTHIAPADAKGEIIGSPVVAPGVINYPFKSLGLCAGITDARFATTTEVYPDSPKATPEECNAAQAAAVCGALDHALAHSVQP